MNEDMNELLLKSVEVLPPLPDTVMKLRKYTDEAGIEVDTKKVAQIIQADPVVTAKLLQLANSPFYGFTSEITTITQIITLLGIGNIKNIVIANSIRDNFKIDVSPYGLDTQDFLANCNEEVNFITHWLGEEDVRLSRSLVPCAMLLRLGIIVFSNFLIQEKKDKFFYALLEKNKFKNITMVENEILGVDHISFLGFLLHRWNFDESLIESICFVNTPHSADDSIKKATYALAITDRLFAPYSNNSPFRAKAAVALVKEAISVGVPFKLKTFIDKLPAKAVENLDKED
ncbi:HDOD domain-containing protein [Campylobacter sp. LR264d]|uniref:HDOD domain-containing protein n=1 Tax=Campylobacter sp. LR264d TaxID=2593544 RepID=UPI00123A7087|nr:HDOD domain-containing protein [Campylobacter sp. LR264d]KAA6231051.1 HDOD domain-containing protein [Campylobacter sp. LR264d]